MQVQDFRVGDQVDVLAHLAEEVATKLGRQKVAVAEAKVYSMKPLSAPNFHALRTHFARIALAAQPGRAVAPSTTP